MPQPHVKLAKRYRKILTFSFVQVLYAKMQSEQRRKGLYFQVNFGFGMAVLSPQPKRVFSRKVRRKLRSSPLSNSHSSSLLHLLWNRFSVMLSKKHLWQKGRSFRKKKEKTVTIFVHSGTRSVCLLRLRVQALSLQALSSILSARRLQHSTHVLLRDDPDFLSDLFELCEQSYVLMKHLLVTSDRTLLAVDWRLSLLHALLPKNKLSFLLCKAISLVIMNVWTGRPECLCTLATPEVDPGT